MGTEDTRHYRQEGLSKKLSDRQIRAFQTMYLGGYGGEAIRERFKLNQNDQAILAQQLGIQRAQHARPNNARYRKKDSAG